MMIMETLYFSSRILTSELYVEGEGKYKCNQDMIANMFLKQLWMDIIIDCVATLAGPVQIAIKREVKKFKVAKQNRKFRKKLEAGETVTIGKKKKGTERVIETMDDWIDLEMPHDFAKATFNLPDSTIGLTYRQMFIWIGTPFCPIMPIVGFIGYIACFYVRAFSLLKFMKPSPIPWDPLAARLMMMKLTFLAAIACLCPTVHFLTSNFVGEMSSWNNQLQLCCGPHLPEANGTLVRNQEYNSDRSITSYFLVDESLSGPDCVGCYCPPGHENVLTSTYCGGSDGGTWRCVDNNDNILAASDGQPVLSYMVHWNDIEPFGQYMIRMLLSPVVLLVFMMFSCITISLLQKTVETLHEQLDAAEIEADIQAQNFFTRLDEVGMLHIME